MFLYDSKNRTRDRSKDPSTILKDRGLSLNEFQAYYTIDKLVQLVDAIASIQLAHIIYVSVDHSTTRKNPLVLFRLILYLRLFSSEQLSRSITPAHGIENRSRETTNQRSEPNMNERERARIENGRRGRDRSSRSTALHASIFIPLINSILVVHRSFIRTSVSLYLTLPRAPVHVSSLSLFLPRTYVHSSPLCPSRCPCTFYPSFVFSSFHLMFPLSIPTSSCARLSRFFFFLRPFLTFVLLVLVRSLSRATSHVAPTHSQPHYQHTRPHDRYQQRNNRFARFVDFLNVHPTIFFLSFSFFENLSFSRSNYTILFNLLYFYSISRKHKSTLINFISGFRNIYVYIYMKTDCFYFFFS